MVRPGGFEPPAFCSGVLGSYGKLLRPKNRSSANTPSLRPVRRLLHKFFAQLSLSEGPVLTPSRVPVSSVEHIKGVVCKLAREKGIDLSLSRQKHRRVGSIELVRSEQNENRAALAFHSRPFVLCGLPIRRPPAGTLQYTRRNGRFKLDIVAHPELGLPFGQDRLIPIWVATLTIKQKSRTVTFRSAAEILDHFDLP